LALAAESHSQLSNLDEVERLCALLLETPRKPQALYLLGLAAYERRQLDKAKSLFEEAYAKALNQREADAPKDQRAAARAAYWLAVTSLDENKLEGSATWVQHGLHEVKASEDFKTEVFLLAVLHRIEAWLGNGVAAEMALSQAEALHRQRSNQEHRQLLLLRAFQSLNQRQWALAEQQFLRLLSLSEGRHCDTECLDAWYGLARAHMYQGELDKAEAALNEHLRLLSTPVGSDVLLFRAELAAGQKNYSKVLEILAETQDMSFTEDERQWVATLRADALAKLGRKAEAEEVLNEVIQQLEGMHRSLAAPGQRSSFLRMRSWAFEWLFEEHIEQGKVFEALEVAERLMAPTFMELLSAKVSPSLSSAEEVHALLWRAEQALEPDAPPPKLSVEKALELLSQDGLLLFFSTDEKFFRLWFHEGKLAEVHSLPLKELKPRIEAFALAPTSTEEAEALGALLWPSELPRGTRVQIVGQEMLRRLPWAALRVRGEWLAAQNAVAWAPSLKVAALLHARARHEGEVFVVGNPTGDLPHAQAEALQVAQRLKAAPFLGARAQRSVFEQLSGARLLHLAAHTSVEAQGANISLADGKLFAREVLERGLAPQTVVLSSCASAKSSDGEGLMSLSGSFLAAGSRQVVASLRSIHDAVSAEFMQHFYAEGGLEEPAWALAKAQTKMADHAPVEQWSAFVLWGTTR
jgi:tetratricopeptide (TPR) repeat protein